MNRLVPIFMGVLASVVMATACSGKSGGTGRDGSVGGDGSQMSNDAGGSDSGGTVGDGGGDARMGLPDAGGDAAMSSLDGGGDGGATNPLCATTDSNGFFPDCSACSAGDCDTIDTPSGTRNACGCGGGCPCGLHCGSYEIAPMVVVSNICVR